MFAARADIRTILELLGHNDVSTTNDLHPGAATGRQRDEKHSGLPVTGFCSRLGKASSVPYAPSMYSPCAGYALAIAPEVDRINPGSNSQYIGST